MRALILPVVITLAGCAPTAAGTVLADDRDARAIAGVLAGLTPDPSNSCLTRLARPQQETTMYGRTILYRSGRDLVYRTDTGGGCEGAARGDVLVTKSITGQPCRGDIVTTVDPVSRRPTGSCTLGDFVTYRRVPAR